MAEKYILVYAELQEGVVKDVSLELLSEASKIASKNGGAVYAALIGSSDAAQVNRLAQMGAKKVFAADDAACAGYSPELYTRILSGLILEQAPGTVLFGATAAGKDLAPRVAARLKAGLISDCTSLTVDDKGQLVLSKAVLNGRLAANIVSRASPQIITVKPGMLDLAKPNAALKAEVVKMAMPEAAAPRMKATGFIKGDSKTINLTEADAIVAGGGGMSSQEDIKLLEELAELLGGTVGVSRVPVDNGWAPLEKQVGQTGKTVTPNLYVACGISGAIYHTMGMKDSKVIIAVNKDKNAPIFKLADIGVVGDLHEVLPAVISQIREELSHGKKV